MATPKKRISPPRQGNRRRNIFLTMPSVMNCTECGSITRRHIVCKVCGIYRGKQILPDTRLTKNTSEKAPVTTA